MTSMLRSRLTNTSSQSVAPGREPSSSGGHSPPRSFGLTTSHIQTEDDEGPNPASPTTTESQSQQPQQQVQLVKASKGPQHNPDVVPIEMFLHVIGTNNYNADEDTASSKNKQATKVAVTTTSSDTTTTLENKSGKTGMKANPAGPKAPNNTSSLQVIEQMFCANQSQLYSVNEIYGYKQKNAITPNPPPTNTPSPEKGQNSDLHNRMIAPSSAYLQLQPGVSASTTTDEGRISSGRHTAHTHTHTHGHTHTAVDASSKKTGETTNGHAAAGGGEGEDDVERQSQQSDGENECVVCLTENKTVLLIPCR